MKIRCGFVTNSSSSSFIIGFSKKSKKAQAAKNLLIEVLPDGYTYGYNRYDYQVYSGMEEIKERLFEETLNEIVPKMKKGYEYYYLTMDNDATSLISTIELLKDAKVVDVLLSFDD